MGGGGEARRKSLDGLTALILVRFCNEHPRDRLISGCGFSTRYRRIERLLLSTEFFLPYSNFMGPVS